MIKLVRAKAPLRLGIAGGGTDVSPYCDEFGGYVLNAAISLFAHCTIRPREDGVVHFEALDLEQSWQLEGEPDTCPNAFMLHYAVYQRIKRDFNHGKSLSFSMTTYSDVVAGSGLGGSSTMVVAMIKAFIEWLMIPLGEYEIAALAYDIERRDVGLSGGRQDQFAATFGGVNFMEFSKDRVIVNPLRIKNWIIDELEESLLLYYTGASRSSANIIDQQINNVVQKNNAAIDAMHLVKENAFLMKNALLTGELSAFGDLMGQVWQAKRKMAAAISNPKIEHIYELAVNAGAVSGKISGAGGGGFMLFYCDPLKRLQVKNALSQLDGYVVPFRFVKYGTRGWIIHE